MPRHRSRRPAAPPVDRRTALLDAARDLLVSDGVAGLTVRGVAERAGCTTIAVYSYWGGRDGLVGALFDEGFARLAEAQHAVPAGGDTADRVVALCRAYRETAQRFPRHYALMLGTMRGGFTPSAESGARARETLGVLERAVHDALPAGARRADRAAIVARQLFAMCHGWVSLALAAMLPVEDATELDDAVRALLARGAPADDRSEREAIRARERRRAP